MTRDYSPFTPGQPVHAELFVGRQEEVKKLVGSVKAATSGKLRTLFLTGERGIGKSSLASYLRLIAEHEHKVLGIHAFLGGVTTLDEMAHRIFERLLNESIGKSWWAKIRDFFGDRIRQVDIFGINFEFNPSERELSRIVRDFAPALRNLIDKLDGEKSSIMIIMDDINGLASSQDFANWIKSFVDEVATSQKPLPLCLVFVGLDERRHSLIKLQPSLARVFEICDIKTWSQDETVKFFVETFLKVGIAVDDDAARFLASFAGGLPVLAHEIGDASFRANSDNRIDIADAALGVVSAADIVGNKHLDPQIYTEIRSPRYRSILRKIANSLPEPSFKAQYVRPNLTTDELKVFNNFLTRMKTLGVIKSNPEEGSGAWKFTNRLHYLYFKLEARRAEKMQKP